MTKTVKVSKSRVFEDIDSRTMKLAETALSGVAADNVASDASETLDGSILTRYVFLRDALIRKKMRFCLSGVEEDYADDSLDRNGELVYTFEFGEGMDISLKSVAILIHEYLVHGAISDWLSKGGSNLATSYASDAEEVASELTGMLRGSSIIEPSETIHKAFGRRR